MNNDKGIAEVMAAGATLRLENERVRVVELRLPPGGEAPMHSHQSLVIYVLAGGKDRWTAPDGSVKENEYRAGEVQYFEPLSHAVENLGPTEIHLLLVELK